MNIGDLILTILADGSKLEADVTRQADSAAAKAGTKAGGTLGARMSSAASKGLTALGAAGGAVFAGAVEAGAKFEDQLRTINTVAGLSDDELSKVGDSIQEVSRETGKTTDDLTAGFYDLVSAGVPASEAIGVLRDSAKFATGALGTTGEAVDLVTSAMNAYGLEAKDSTRITDIFAKAVADGKVTAAELGASIANIAPIASSAGISLEEVAAGYAILTAKGVPAAQAATQMRAAISALLTPNAQLNEIQKQTGINFAELARTKGLAVALEELRKATGGNADAFAKALGSVEGYQYALAVTGENAGVMADEIVAASNSAGLATAQYDEKSKSSVEQAKRMSATLNTLAQDFGGVFSAAGPFLLTLNQMAPALRGLVSPAKLVGALLGGLAGRLSKPLIGAITGAFGSAEIATRLGTLGDRLQTFWIKGMTKVDRVSGAIGDMLGRLPGSGKLSAGADKLGSFLGSKLGKGLSIAFAAVAVLEVFNTYNEIKAGLDKQSAQISSDVANQVATGTLEQLQASKAALEQGLVELNGVWDAGLFTTDSRKKIEADLAAVNAKIAAAAEVMPKEAAAGIAAGQPDVAAALASTFGQTVVASGLIENVGKAAAKAAGDIPAKMADAIRAKQNAVTDELAALRDAMKNELSPSAEIARNIGILTSSELAAGLKSKRPGVRDEARRVRAAAEERIAELIAAGGSVGKSAAQKLADGLKSKNPTVRAEARRIKNIVAGKLEESKGPARAAGQAAAAAFAAAARAALEATTITATFRVARAGSANVARATGGPIIAGTPYLVNEQTPRSEVIVPSTGGYVLTRAQAEAAMADSAGGGGGDTYVYNVDIDGGTPVRDSLDVARQLQRFGQSGAFAARPGG